VTGYDLDLRLGVPVIFSTVVARDQYVWATDLDKGLLVTHPDEEPHLWMSVGEVDWAFLALDRILKQKINAAAHEATKRVDELTDKYNRDWWVNSVLRDLV
jgi:hypothetical protein